ncbi:MAG: serine protease [candidate division Zixibacteria bacterium]|nr:serine protease [candidate division Zixibacteria bacterium]
MLTISVRTVRKQLALFFMTVFFSQFSLAADSSLSTLERGLNELIFSLSRSVVTVESSRRVSIPSFRGTADEALQRLVSSGIICDTAGYILAAAPMVVGQEKIMVNLNNQLYPARLVGVDYYSDLALLQIRPGIGQPVTFSDDYACAGQMIISLGNAYGLNTSPSMGFCAGLREDGNVQTTVPVSSGSIGGGIFDLSGNLLGVIVGQVGQDNQSALAVPSYKIPPVVEYLKKYGDHQAGFIGIATAEIEIYPPIEIRENTSLIDSRTGRRIINGGTVITSVMPMSPADRAGLRRGDLLISYNNRAVGSPLVLADEVRQSQPGTKVVMEILRQNTLYNVQVEIGQKSIANYVPAVSTVRNRPQMDYTADSLAGVLNSLKEEIRQMEDRLKQFK